MNVLENIYNLPFWNLLTNFEKEIIKKKSYIKEYNQNSIINSDSEYDCLGYIYVISGQVRSFVKSNTGREITFLNLQQGDDCALTAHCIITPILFKSYFLAVSDIKLLIIPPDILKIIFSSNIYVKLYIYKTIANYFSSSISLVRKIFFEKLDKKIANLLLENIKNAHNIVYLQHKEVANKVNSSRVSVSRILKTFSEKGLIECKHGYIIVKDKDLLLKLANNT